MTPPRARVGLGLPVQGQNGCRGGASESRRAQPICLKLNKPGGCGSKRRRSAGLKQPSISDPDPGRTTPRRTKSRQPGCLIAGACPQSGVSVRCGSSSSAGLFRGALQLCWALTRGAASRMRSGSSNPPCGPIPASGSARAPGQSVGPEGTSEGALSHYREALRIRRNSDRRAT